MRTQAEHSPEYLLGQLASEVLYQHVGDVGFTGASAEIDDDVFFLGFLQQLILTRGSWYLTFLIFSVTNLVRPGLELLHPGLFHVAASLFTSPTIDFSNVWTQTASLAPLVCC